MDALVSGFQLTTTSNDNIGRLSGATFIPVGNITLNRHILLIFSTFLAQFIHTL